MTRITIPAIFALALSFSSGMISGPAAGAETAGAARDLVVPRWQPHDFVFKADLGVANPFMTDFSAELKSPDGKLLVFPGFFDGDGTWKVRVAPVLEGTGSLFTRSNVKALDGQTIEFTCVKNNSPHAHGLLRVDKEHPHHFIFDDGTHFFMQGYEYDWLWALDMDTPGIPTIENRSTLSRGMASTTSSSTLTHTTRPGAKAGAVRMITAHRCCIRGKAITASPTTAE